MSALPDQPLGETTRHGRAADAFIASYVRELLADDELDASGATHSEPLPRPTATAPDDTTVEATL